MFRVRRGSRLLAAAFGATLCCAQGSFAQDGARWSGVERIVAIADVHGAYDELVELLRAADVIDAADAWSGGRTHLVSLGDLLDRGGDSRAVMDLLMRLEREAAAQGGAVHVVLGNHELMNLTGDLRYVSAEEYAAFAEDEPADVRAAAFERFRRTAGEELSNEEARDAFDVRYPTGYFAHRLAFERGGRYGEWLLSRPAVIVINDTAFVHGGLPELVARTSADEINARVREHLVEYFAARERLVAAGVLPEIDMGRDFEIAREALAAVERGEPTVEPELTPALEALVASIEAPVLGLDGPLWYRGAAYCNPAIEVRVLEGSLDRLGAARAVVGHTVTDDRRVRALYDGRLIMLDTGMLEDVYAGRPAALILEGGDPLVQYVDPVERRPPEPGRIEAFGATDDEIVAALESGDVRRARPDTLGAGAGQAQTVEVRYQGRTLDAAFIEQDRAADAELAAYALDRLLGLHLVPPTVEREVDGEVGALQLRYADAVSEAQRLERGLPSGTWCAIEPQIQLMRAFDVILLNTDRSAENVLYTRDLSYLRSIGHAAAFGTQRRPRIEQGAVTIPPDLRSALAALDETALETALGGRLDRRRIRALLARRDVLLEGAP